MIGIMVYVLLSFSDAVPAPLYISVYQTQDKCEKKATILNKWFREHFPGSRTEFGCVREALRDTVED